MIKGVLFILALALPVAAQAQAFGIQMGAPVSKYGGKPIPGVKYGFDVKVPDPNAEFESYMVLATPQSGVCKVTGLGATHRDDDYGTDTRHAFMRIKNALEKRYGASKTYDFIRSGALWKEPREWVWSIFKKERTLATFWDKEENSDLPLNVRSIFLDTRAVSPSAPYVTLSYEFANIDSCLSAVRSENENGL